MPGLDPEKMRSTAVWDDVQFRGVRPVVVGSDAAAAETTLQLGVLGVVELFHRLWRFLIKVALSYLGKLGQSQGT